MTFAFILSANLSQYKSMYLVHITDNTNDLDEMENV